MKIVNKVLLLLLIILTWSCSKQSIEVNWVLIGSDIRLEIEVEKKYIKLLENEKLIFLAKIIEHKFEEDSKLMIKATMQKIGKRKEYQLKYQKLKNFTIWFEKKTNQLKMIFNKFYNKPYFFSLQPKNQVTTKFRMLSTYEVSQFNNTAGIKSARKDNNLEIILNKNPLMTKEEVIKFEKKPFRYWVKKKYNVENNVITEMLDYMLDKDPSTYWGTEDFWGTEMELAIKDSFGKKLKNPAKIRGIYFSTGNLDKKSKFYNFHRPKDLYISFSKEYDGSLGTPRANYNFVNYKVTLPDHMDDKYIVFFEALKANSIRIRFDDFYLGIYNSLAIYDFDIYIDSE